MRVRVDPVMLDGLPHGKSFGVSTMRHAAAMLPLALIAATVLCAGFAPEIARAAGDGSGQIVSCKLPGEIRSVGGHPHMAAGRIVQTTSADCRQRGGEYTVAETTPPVPTAPAASPSPTAAEARIVSCLLPAQTRQLGEKVRYRSGRRVERMALADCRVKGGRVYVPRKATPRKRST